MALKIAITAFSVTSSARAAANITCILIDSVSHLQRASREQLRVKQRGHVVVDERGALHLEVGREIEQVRADAEHHLQWK